MNYILEHQIEQFGNAVDKVLNGSFLFYVNEVALSKDIDAIQLFEYLLENGHFDEIYPHYINTDLHLYEAMILFPDPLPKQNHAFKKLSYDDVSTILLSSLTNKDYLSR